MPQPKFTSRGKGHRTFRVRIARRRSLISLLAAVACLAALIVGILPASAAIGPGVITTYHIKAVEQPAGIITGPGGDLWFTNGFNSVGAITSTGTISVNSSLATGGSVPVDIAFGPDQAVWFTVWSTSTVGRLGTNGAVTSYTGGGIDGPLGITLGSDGALWFTNPISNSIGRITTAGVISNFTGAGISDPEYITSGPDGALWFTNFGNDSIGRISTGGAVSNFVGTGIDQPTGITTGPDGALWFTNDANNTIGRITTAGVVRNYRGTGISGPFSIAAGVDGALWFTNSGNNSIGSITPSGVVTNYTDDQLIDPQNITSGPDGALWFTEFSVGVIGRITTAVTPEVTGFNPASGPPGTTVTINGANLEGPSHVYFNGAPSRIVSISPTKIVVTVPTAAKTGQINVLTTCGKATSRRTFTVT